MSENTERMNRKIFNLLRWPIDICVLSLAFCYGLTKLLDSIWRGPAPNWCLLSEFSFAVLVSTFFVRRYMPSDAHLDSQGETAVALWINTSLALSTIVPVVGVFFADSPLFWASAVLSSILKAGYSLESDQKKSTRQATMSIKMESDDLLEKQIVRKQSPLERFMFEAVPDAYALRPIPTAILLTGASSGFASAFLFGFSGAPNGLAIGTMFLGLYIVISGIARGRALHLTQRISAARKHR